MSTSLKTFIINNLNYRFNLDEDKAKEEEIIESLRRNVEFRGTNLWALIFAILIASIGLNVNSTAVIIGAMLISPLMGPIMGIGLGAGIFDFQLIKFSLKNLFIAVVIALMSSSLYFWLTPIHQAQSELLARTTPTIWDVLIALFGGLAGIIASSRKNISNSIPGVAIATALMPPLCTAGYGIGTGNFYYFAGAFYLFLINSVFISIATFLMVRFLKFKPSSFVNKATELKVRKYIWTIAVLTILPSLFLAYNFVQQEFFKQKINDFIRNEIEANNLYVINQRIKPAARKAVLLVYGDNLNDSLLNAISMRKKNYRLDPSDLNILKTMNHIPVNKDQNLQQKNDARLDEHLSAIIQKDTKIKLLESQIKKITSRDTSFYSEFNALFGPTKELSISKTILYNKDATIDTVLLLYIKPVRKFKNEKQVKNWLEARYRSKLVRVIIE
jgi:uncharacterized hydrophobic protein (TIGR00271 family)